MFLHGRFTYLDALFDAPNDFQPFLQDQAE
jgi:hypothetical protein